MSREHVSTVEYLRMERRKFLTDVVLGGATVAISIPNGISDLKKVDEITREADSETRAEGKVPPSREAHDKASEFVWTTSDREKAERIEETKAAFTTRADQQDYITAFEQKRAEKGYSGRAFGAFINTLGFVVGATKTAIGVVGAIHRSRLLRRATAKTVAENK